MLARLVVYGNVQPSEARKLTAYDAQQLLRRVQELRSEEQRVHTQELTLVMEGMGAIIKSLGSLGQLIAKVFR